MQAARVLVNNRRDAIDHFGETIIVAIKAIRYLKEHFSIIFVAHIIHREDFIWPSSAYCYIDASTQSGR